MHAPAITKPAVSEQRTQRFLHSVKSVVLGLQGPRRWWLGILSGVYNIKSIFRITPKHYWLLLLCLGSVQGSFSEDYTTCDATTALMASDTVCLNILESSKISTLGYSTIYACKRCLRLKNLRVIKLTKGFLGDSEVKASASNVGDPDSIPGLGRSPGEGNGSEKVGLKLNIQKTKIMASGPITSWQIDGETVADFIMGGSKITADGDCSHEIKRCSLLGKKVMTNLDSILKSRDITLLTKVHLVKAMVFPVVMYGCESWTVKKAECRRIDASKLWCWRRLLRVP